MTENVKIIFLHHSTGKSIWQGNNKNIHYIFGKIKGKVFKTPNEQCHVPRLFRSYNKKNHTNYFIEEKSFPKEESYGWNNYPFDYYNIWVKNAGPNTYMEEPTLEILTKDYDIIIFKHCFPVSNVQADEGNADINSDYKSISNYKLQYNALKEKLHQFPDTKFILWTGAALIKNHVSEDEAKRAKEFFTWVKEEWDSEGDNIYLWDFYSLETERDIYLQEKNAFSGTNSHPNKSFADYAGNLFFNRIIDVIENNGNNTSITGEQIKN